MRLPVLLALILSALAGNPVRAQQEAQAGPVPTPAVPDVHTPLSQPVTLTAFLSGDAKPLRAGLVWRVFRDKGAQAQPELVTKVAIPIPTATLEPGSYIVHAGYGLASATKRITVGTAPLNERLTISAGALKLGGMIAGQPIERDRLDFSIYLAQQNNPEGRLVATKVRAGDLVRLPEGSYHVVSTYGESNAIMRIDLKVEPGRITEATLNHRAATVTLKLVDNPGGEAVAGTTFNILTPGGDVVRDAIGAYPKVVLAEGEYTLIARNNGKVYTRNFRVETGLDVDVEVLSTQS